MGITTERITYTDCQDSITDEDAPLMGWILAAGSALSGGAYLYTMWHPLLWIVWPLTCTWLVYMLVRRIPGPAYEGRHRRYEP